MCAELVVVWARLRRAATLGLDLLNVSSHVSRVHLEIKTARFSTCGISLRTIKKTPNIISSALNLTPSLNYLYFLPLQKRGANCAVLFPTVVTARS